MYLFRECHIKIIFKKKKIRTYFTEKFINVDEKKKKSE